MDDLIKRLRARRMLAADGLMAGVGRANAKTMWVTDEPDPDCSQAAAEIESLRRDAERYRWLATEHAVMLLKRFPSPKPYHDSTEVIDAAIDAAMTGETR